MVVHHVSASWEEANGRFLGPVRLLEHAGSLLPELRLLPLMPWEWKSWVDEFEASGRLAPMLRWRMPDAALLWLWARHDGRTEDMEALGTEAAPGLIAAAAWDRARRAWAHVRQTARRAHPLDEPDQAWAPLVECPAAVPWTPHTYAPLEVRSPGAARSHLDENRCVPLFRGWQALLLVEHVLAEGRSFPPPAPDRERSVRSEPLRWAVASKAGDFVRHRAALEALSWFTSYRQHALQHAEGENPDPGAFAPPGTAGNKGQSVVRGAAMQALLVEERRVAREALERHNVDEKRLLDAASWLGRAAQDRRSTGHAAAGAAYAALMRDAFELLIGIGHTRSEVAARMDAGEELRRDLFPDFEERTRQSLRRQLHSLAAEFHSRPDPRSGDFDASRIEGFLGWLEGRGLLAAHMAVPAIMGYGHRPDRSADVGVGLHVAALAAWVEHVAGDLTPQAGIRLTLKGKLERCWERHVLGAEVWQACNDRWLDVGIPFRERVGRLLANPANDRAGWMARDALVARAIRDESLHRGLRAFTRMDMRDAACILLRTAMGAWLLAR